MAYGLQAELARKIGVVYDGYGNYDSAVSGYIKSRLFLLFTKLKWVGTFLPLTITCFLGIPFLSFSCGSFCGKRNPEGNDRSHKIAQTGAGRIRVTF